MLLRRVRLTKSAAKEKLEALHDQHQDLEEALIATFGAVLATAQDDCPDAVSRAAGEGYSQCERRGRTSDAAMRERVRLHGNNDLPLLWPIHAKCQERALSAPGPAGYPFGDPGRESVGCSPSRYRISPVSSRRIARRNRPQLSQRNDGTVLCSSASLDSLTDVPLKSRLCSPGSRSRSRGRCMPSCRKVFRLSRTTPCPGLNASHVWPPTALHRRYQKAARLLSSN